MLCNGNADLSYGCTFKYCKLQYYSIDITKLVLLILYIAVFCTYFAKQNSNQGENSQRKKSLSFIRHVLSVTLAIILKHKFYFLNKYLGIL